MPGEQSGDNGLERSVRSQGDDTEAAAAPRAASAAEVPEPQHTREGQRAAQQQPDQLEVRPAVLGPLPGRTAAGGTDLAQPMTSYMVTSRTLEPVQRSGLHYTENAELYRHELLSMLLLGADGRPAGR